MDSHRLAGREVPLLQGNGIANTEELIDGLQLCHSSAGV
jgi:hypothetical protein